jgi:8-oxo-dGTP pyrophosphatase MutT (NUDIX family)
VTPEHGDAVRLLTAYVSRDERQATLRADYLAHLQACPNGTRRECLPDHLTASAVVIEPEGGRVLLGLHAKAGLWLQMGGHIEEGDGTIALAAMREAAEESGIAGLRLRSELPLALDRHPAPCSPDARYHLDVQFLVIPPAGAEPVASPEQTELRCCPYDNLAEPTDDAVRRLVAAARSALSAQRP